MKGAVVVETSLGRAYVRSCRDRCWGCFHDRLACAGMDLRNGIARGVIDKSAFEILAPLTVRRVLVAGGESQAAAHAAGLIIGCSHQSAGKVDAARPRSRGGHE